MQVTSRHEVLIILYFIQIYAMLVDSSGEFWIEKSGTGAEQNRDMLFCGETNGICHPVDMPFGCGTVATPLWLHLPMASGH